MSFNENTAQQEQLAGGSEIRETRNPVISVMDQTNTEVMPSNPAPSGTMALAWWDDMKYYWRASRNGGHHLAPQDSYVDDVLTEGDYEIEQAAKNFTSDNSEDLKLAKDELISATNMLEARKAFDPSGVEAAALIRTYRDRAIIARKIAGSKAVSANHRLQNAHATGGDLESVRESDFFKSDRENCERWAYKACYYEYILSQLSPEDVAEVIPSIPEALATGVKRSLYDDAVEQGNKLKQPAPAKRDPGKALSAEELRMLRA